MKGGMRRNQTVTQQAPPPGVQQLILGGLQPYANDGFLKGLTRSDRRPKHIYAGTVDPEEIARRRAANRRARRSRRINRGRS